MKRIESEAFRLFNL